MQTLVRLLYPPLCAACGAPVDRDFGICGACLGDLAALGASACWTCGAPLVGEVSPGDQCDDCLSDPPPWSRGFSAARYAAGARRLVLKLKHGDRPDLARTLGGLMTSRLPGYEAGLPKLIVPVPLHPFRLWRRRYNQAVLLADEIARRTDGTVLPDALLRTRATAPQSGPDRATRFRNLNGALAANDKHRATLAGQPVLLIDDVMTSGATLTAACRALQSAGVAEVWVAVFARVLKEDFSFNVTSGVSD